MTAFVTDVQELGILVVGCDVDEEKIFSQKMSTNLIDQTQLCALKKSEFQANAIRGTESKRPAAILVTKRRLGAAEPIRPISQTVNSSYVIT